MKSAESNYVEEFARTYLNIAPQYLNITTPTNIETRAIYACYRAWQESIRNSPTISRYFYKRYRAVLLEFLKKNHNLWRGKNLDDQFINFDLLSIWDDRTNDPINFLASLVPPILREIFPSHIAKSSTLAGIKLPNDLPTPADQDIWNYAGNPAPGISQTTLDLIQQFDKLEFFRNLPPETILELGKKFYTVHYAPGETIVWQNENNNDVFILLDGKLEAVVEGRSANTIINAGEVFGEIAWLTNSSRVATVHALIPSLCLVIKSSGLQFLSLKKSFNPYINCRSDSKKVQGKAKLLK